MNIGRWIPRPICLLLVVLVSAANVFVFLINDHLQKDSLNQQWSFVTKQSSDSDSPLLAGRSVNGGLYEQTKDQERPSLVRVSHPRDDSRHDNTLPLLATPPPASFKFYPFPALITNQEINILEVLRRWSNLSQSFLDRRTPIPRFRPSFRAQPTPVPRECRLFTANIHNKSTALFARLQKPLVECFVNEPKVLTPFEQNGNHIMFTVRTTVSLHSKRLPVLFQTWMSAVNRSNIFIVTDGIDEVLDYRALEAGMKYFVSVPGYERLCEKAGDEISLMFQPENQHYKWFCHTDDDMYVNLEMLVATLAKFKQDDPIYFGKSGTVLEKPRRVLPESELGSPGTPYRFAVGGFYCLNRAMLEKSSEWIGGRRAFGRTCNQTKEPEDVTVGFVVGVLLELELQGTKLIHTHGANLRSSASYATLKYQVAFSYGYGAISGNGSNVIYVPDNLYSVREDKSQFLSLHCHYYPLIGWCLHRHRNREQSQHIR